MSDAVFEQVREHLAGVAQEATVAHGVLALLVALAAVAAWGLAGGTLKL